MGLPGDRPALLGRAPALDVLTGAAAAATASRGRTVLVAGEAGIGKTALLTALAEHVSEAGGAVLWGQCWEGDGTPAYWPWVQVLRAGVAAGSPAAGAVALLPEAGAPWPVRDDVREARFALFDAVSQHLAALAAARPVIVVLDDLHWADDGSLAMLAFCARHLQTSRVLLVGAYREEELTPGVAAVAAAAHVLPLAGLSPRDVTELVATVSGGPVPPALGEAVWRRTGGNPLFAGEVARLLIASGGVDDLLGARDVVPDSVREVLERRLARLSRPCTDLLALVAVAGPAVPVELVERLVPPSTPTDVLLAEAVHAAVLVPPASPGESYRFTHDLFRETVLRSVPVEEQRRAHLATGRVLEELLVEGAAVHPAELAAHYAAAGTAAADETLHYSVLAAREATARLAFPDACAHYRRALAALAAGAQGRHASRLELLLELAAATARAGDTPGALDAYRDAARLALDQEDATAFASAAIGVHGLGWRGSHAVAIDLLEQAARRLPPAPSAARARVLASLARDLHHSLYEQDWDRAAALAGQAVADARAIEDPETEAFCLLALHDAQWRPGTAARRLVVLEQMLVAARLAGDRDLVAQTHLLRAAARIELGDPRGVADLEAYCRLSDELGHAQGRYGAASRRATIALLAGRLEEARRLAGEARDLGLASGEPDAGGVRETLVHALAVVQGGDAAAGLSLDSDPWPLAVPLARVVVHLSCGETEPARALLAPLRVASLPRTHDLEVLAFAARAVAAVGTREQQVELYAAMAVHAGTHIVVGGCASYYGAVDHHLGLLARALGRTEDARRHLQRAAELHDRLGASAWAVRSRAELAACGASPVDVPEQGTFRRRGEVWDVAYRDQRAHVPDAKGLRDLAVLLSRPGQAVSAAELQTGQPVATGADPVLDARAKAEFRRRLAELDAEIDGAEADHDPYRVDRAQAERAALLAELAAAAGLHGRDRRLGDQGERARKAVTARVQDALRRIERVNAPLAEHLQATVRTGAWCTYAPTGPVRWQL